MADIRKVHRSLCFWAGLQSLGGRLIKTGHRDLRQVTMGFWHAGTRQESSYRSSGTRPIMVTCSQITECEATSVPLPPRGLGPRDGREAGHPGVKWPPSLGKKATGAARNQTRLRLHHHQLISVRLAYYGPIDSRPLTYWAGPQARSHRTAQACSSRVPPLGAPFCMHLRSCGEEEKAVPALDGKSGMSARQCTVK